MVAQWQGEGRFCLRTDHPQSSVLHGLSTELWSTDWRSSSVQELVWITEGGLEGRPHQTTAGGFISVWRCSRPTAVSRQSELVGGTAGKCLPSYVYSSRRTIWNGKYLLCLDHTTSCHNYHDIFMSPNCVIAVAFVTLIYLLLYMPYWFLYRTHWLLNTQVSILLSLWHMASESLIWSLASSR